MFETELKRYLSIIRSEETLFLRFSFFPQMNNQRIQSDFYFFFFPNYSTLIYEYFFPDRSMRRVQLNSCEFVFRACVRTGPNLTLRSACGLSVSFLLICRVYMCIGVYACIFVCVCCFFFRVCPYKCIFFCLLYVFSL